jgi:hypothetical protein
MTFLIFYSLCRKPPILRQQLPLSSERERIVLLLLRAGSSFSPRSSPLDHCSHLLRKQFDEPWKEIYGGVEPYWVRLLLPLLSRFELTLLSTATGPLRLEQDPQEHHLPRLRRHERRRIELEREAAELYSGGQG